MLVLKLKTKESVSPTKIDQLLQLMYLQTQKLLELYQELAHIVITIMINLKIKSLQLVKRIVQVKSMDQT